MDKSFSRRLRLNSAILKNLYWQLPVDDKGHENYMPVGRGVKSSHLCGRWVGLDVCKNVDEHEGVTLNGEDCTGKVVNRNRHLWCFKSSCPICFIRGWSVRGARSITGRLNTGVKRGLGEIEHIVVSPPIVDHNLPESVLRVKCRKALSDRGVVGGTMIFHGFPIDRERGVLMWRPHYHVLAFIFGGYGKCRGCKKVCFMHPECSGFERRTRLLYESDGCIVKVLARRKTVFGTAFYQLNHATVRLGVKRFHTFTWFGSCGNRKFASDKAMAKVVCPACGDEYERDFYIGKEPFVKNVGHPNYKAVFLRPEFDENGKSNYMGSVDMYVRGRC